jgi:hypothetical protein
MPRGARLGASRSQGVDQTSRFGSLGVGGAELVAIVRNDGRQRGSWTSGFQRVNHVATGRLSEAARPAAAVHSVRLTLVGPAGDRDEGREQRAPQRIGR